MRLDHASTLRALLAVAALAPLGACSLVLPTSAHQGGALDAAIPADTDAGTDASTALDAGRDAFVVEPDAFVECRSDAECEASGFATCNEGVCSVCSSGSASTLVAQATDLADTFAMALANDGAQVDVGMAYWTDSGVFLVRREAMAGTFPTGRTNFLTTMATISGSSGLIVPISFELRAQESSRTFDVAVLAADGTGASARRTRTYVQFDGASEVTSGSFPGADLDADGVPTLGPVRMWRGDSFGQGAFFRQASGTLLNIEVSYGNTRGTSTTAGISTDESDPMDAAGARLFVPRSANELAVWNGATSDSPGTLATGSRTTNVAAAALVESTESYVVAYGTDDAIEVHLVTCPAGVVSTGCMYESRGVTIPLEGPALAVDVATVAGETYVLSAEQTADGLSHVRLRLVASSGTSWRAFAPSELDGSTDPGETYATVDLESSTLGATNYVAAAWMRAPASGSGTRALRQQTLRVGCE